MTLLFAIHTASTWALVGLIWTMQLVHYPLFAQVGADAFRPYHQRHMRRITLLAAPLMAVEVLTALWLVVRGEREFWFLVSLGPLAFNWIATWWSLIPAHLRLSRGFEAEAHQRLLRGNRWRVLAWSVRGLCLLARVW